jgi:ribosomal protein S18 acetylase RimI-like enzyme
MSRHAVTITDRLTSSTCTIESATSGDIPAMVEMLSRGMRDNPLHVAAFGTDPDLRERKVLQMFRLLAKNPAIVANAMVARDANGTIVGAYSFSNPGSCQPSGIAKLMMTPVLLTLGIGNGRRAASWLKSWSNHDPDVRHYHFGPIGVDAHLQGQGIGSELMRAFCQQMDQVGENAYLETDKEINVGFYRKFGFEVIEEAEVIGVPNWFMLRRPA